MSTGPSSSEQGAVAVIIAIVLSVLLLFAAIAIDLGGLRVDRSASQLAADMAAAAAVQDFDPVIPGDAQRACLEAVIFAEENLGIDLDASPNLRCEDEYPESQPCSEALPPGAAEYTGTDRFGNDYTVTISNPVLASDDQLMGTQPAADSDGEACERIGVSIQRTRDYLFARFAGSGATTMSAVGLGAQPGDEGEFASLIVLHRQECQALVASGTGAVVRVDPLVRNEGTEQDPDIRSYAGIITVDSAKSGCGKNSEIFDLDGGASILAPEGRINSYALRVGVPREEVHPDSPNLSPSPRRGPQITRAPVDHLYNCLDEYPSGPRWSPEHADSVGGIEACDRTQPDPPDPFMKELHDVYQEMTADNLPVLPAGDAWVVVSDEAAYDDLAFSCSKLEGRFGSAEGADRPEGTTGRYWFIDCPGTNNKGFEPSDVHFDGVDAVVTNGRINLQSSDALTVTGITEKDGGAGAVLYLQRGDLGKQGRFSFTDTFVYIDNGIVEMSGQADLTWEGPLLPEFGKYDPEDPPAQRACAAHDGPAPAAACFSPLTLWSNSPEDHTLGGGGTLDIAGTFFAPNAGSDKKASWFRLAGGAGQDLQEAQFFVGRLRVDGSGAVTMRPNPETNVEVELTGTALVR